MNGRKARVHMTSVASVVMIVSGLGACGSDSDRRNTQTAFEPSIETWSLPLDDYYPTVTQQNHAVSLKVAACMKGVGVRDWPIEDPARYLPPTFTSRVRKVFNEKLARQFGYHSGQSARPVDLVEPPLTPDQEITLTTCQRAAQKEFGSESKTFAFVQGQAAAGADSALRSKPVKLAAEEWHDCMLPLGLPDLPATPLGNMPTDSQRAKFGLQNNEDAIGKQTLVATPQEIREAVFDASCRESSGYSRALYQQEVEAGTRAIEKYQEKMSSAYAQNQAMNKRINRAISHGGQ